MKEKIYLLPGLMNNEKLWSKIIPFLKRDFELVYIPIPLTKDFNEAVEVLDTFFKEEKINLLGFSLGAYLVSFYASKRAQKIKRLFLVAGTPSSLSAAEVKRRELTLKQMDNLRFKKLSTKNLKALLEKKNQDNEELLNIIEEMFESFTLQEYKLQLSSTFDRVDIYKELLALDIPINFLFSKKDRLLNHKSIEKIQKKHQHIILKSLNSTSHMLPLEEPELLSLEIKKWINR
ncbi:alpha/beta fold hydrolase [Halarcobacter anaerophilus]|uniref:AB hydrolase-1 domain-containing protein n=1 Tax=Halarcobacter anaerophilus TaxID=877500 RepID=A0A4V1LQF9_9BACT|nr:alpha/beta fold hydrolase [Halarcobacter anaerophilus]QDF29310.1 alpha/beta hydrolase family protein [Halarcobacter anaerophilus]RXJ64558.1 hypothetical protein CRV06_00965 [Halarcobacter anaerophilus]